MTDASNYPKYIDGRDAQVVEACIPGEVYGVEQLQDAYKQTTDIRRDSTAQDRVRTLMKTPAFEYVSVGRFKFTGVTDD